ncbi:MAG: hypothetical protein IJX80_03675 [Clostridia bacterium]|nr:hypothetical protein [Clostridia bacterium]
MNIEKKELRASVREGYQILLRVEAELNVPTDSEKINDFYQRLAEKCMLWATDVHGEMLRRDFLSMESIRERSQCRTQEYRFLLRPIRICEEYAVFLCESWLKGRTGGLKNGYHRISHVWDLQEETILPFSQILKKFEPEESDFVLPFVPDGIYPTGDELVFFKNASAENSFLEERRKQKANK